MRNAFDRLPAFPGSKTEDQNELFGFAMYHCLAASNSEIDNWNMIGLALSNISPMNITHRFTDNV